MSFLAAQWDTLGWAKFRSGDAESAENFVHSAWNLSPNSVVGEHLVEIYEKLGKKQQADHICQLALAAPRTGEEPDTKEKLVAAQKRIGLSKPEPGPASGKNPRFGAKGTQNFPKCAR